jgi:hypothetical protein
MLKFDPGKFVWRSVMSSYKRPRVFDPLDLEIIDLVYEAALAQIAAREPLSDPSKDLECQESLKKLVLLLAKPGSVEFDDLLDKVLEHASHLVSSSQLQTRPASEIEGDSGKRPL